MSHLAGELGWYSPPVPRALVRGAAAVAGVLAPVLPEAAQALHALHVPVVVDTTRA